MPHSRHGCNRLRKILLGLRGFSAENLKKMRLFYEAWTMLDNTFSIPNEHNSVIAITELSNTSKSVIVNTEIQEIDIYHTMIIPNTLDFPAAEFLAVPFTHHSRIRSKTKTTEERYYYIRRCAQEHMSVDAIVRLMNDNAYERQTPLPNNFSKNILDAKEARKAIMM